MKDADDNTATGGHMASRALGLMIVMALACVACSGTGDETSVTTIITETTAETVATEALPDIDSAADALLTLDEMPPGWQNIAPVSEFQAEQLNQFLLACGETIEVEIGVDDFGLFISHSEPTTGSFLNHSVRVQDVDTAIELFERTNAAAESCQASWEQSLGDGLHDLTLIEPPNVADRGDDTSVYATMSVPQDASLASFATALAQVRCGPVVSRLAITASDAQQLSDTFVDDLVERAFAKLAALGEDVGISCG